MNNNEESSQTSLDLIKQNYGDENETRDNGLNRGAGEAHELDTTITQTNENSETNDVVYKISVSKNPFQIKSITLMNNSNHNEVSNNVNETNQVTNPSTSGYESRSNRLSPSRTQKRQYETLINDEKFNSDLNERTQEKNSNLMEAGKNPLCSNDDESEQIASESKRTKSDLNSGNEACSSDINIKEVNNEAKRDTDTDFDEQDVDLSEVQLSAKLKEKKSQKTRGKLEDDENPIKTSDLNETLNENESGKNVESKNAADANNKTKKAKEPLSNPKDPKFWENIYNTDYFHERSLTFNDILNREFGFSKRLGHGSQISLTPTNNPTTTKKLIYDQKIQSTRQFMRKAMNSLEYLRRMKLSHNLSYHEGCVNALNFNRIGTLLASGSDDFQVCLWDWARSEIVLSFDSGHKSNVFQTKFIPFTGDSQIVTCARDGQVRLALISSTGSHLGTKKLAKHADSCHKLSIEYDSSNLFLSCGEDAVVYEIDLRQQAPAKILTVKSTDRNYKVPLYSIASNPSDTYQFVVCGMDQYLRVYDKRTLASGEAKPLKMFCPLHLKDSRRASVTSAVYNSTGTEILASYSSEDIYLFDAQQEEEKDFKHRYKGHQNSETIKGVNFYGAYSDFVVSGSDDGRIFFWEKSSEQIVQTLKGDEHGVVNVLEPHPSFPILATSGLDSDIKIWTPTNQIPNSLENLEDIIKDNQRHRDSSRHFSLSSFEFELLLLLMHRPNSRGIFFRSSRDDETQSSPNESSSTVRQRHRRRLIDRIRFRRNDDGLEEEEDEDMSISDEEDDPDYVEREDEDDEDEEDDEDNDDDDDDDEEDQDDEFLINNRRNRILDYNEDEDDNDDLENRNEDNDDYFSLYNTDTNNNNNNNNNDVELSPQLEEQLYHPETARNATTTTETTTTNADVNRYDQNEAGTNPD